MSWKWKLKFEQLHFLESRNLKMLIILQNINHVEPRT